MATATIEEPKIKFTTPTEADAYEALKGKVFVRKDGKPGLFRVVHVYPEFKGVTDSEYVAKLYVEKFERKSVRINQQIEVQNLVISAETKDAKEFQENYKPE